MAQTSDQCIARLQQMASEGQQTWDLSPEDQEAIRMAVQVISVLEYLDQMPSFIESGPLAGGGLCVSIGVREKETESHVSAFVSLGKDILREQ